LNPQAQRRFVRDNLLVGAANLVSQLQGLVLIPLVIKLSGPGVYGSYVLASSLFLMATTVFSLGIGYRYRRNLPSVDDVNGRAELFWAGALGQTATVTIGSIALSLLLPVFEKIFFKGEATFGPGWIVAFCLSYVLYTQAGEFFRYTHRIGVLSFAALANNLLALVIYVALGARGAALTLERLLAVQVACNLLFAVILWARIVREIPWRPQLELARYRDDIKVGFPLVLSGLTETVSSVVDRYVIGAWFSSAAVGIYAPAVSLGSLILFFPRISGVVLPPLLARATDQREEGTSRMLLRMNVRLFLVLGIPAVVGLALVGQSALELLANDVIARTGRYIVPVVAASSVLYGIGSIASGVLFVERKTHRLLAANFVITGLKIVLSIVALTAGAGLVGVAWATLVAQGVGLAIMLAGISTPMLQLIGTRFLVTLLAASLMMALAVALVRMSMPANTGRILELGVSVAAGMVCFAVAMFVLSRRSKEAGGFVYGLIHGET
jgi:O-antigen/teichoic acid export membrane protein